MKAKTWIVVANSWHAKVFQADKPGLLSEVHQIEHPDAKLHNKDLNSDRPGRTNASYSPGHSALEPPTSAKQKEVDHFARQISDYLDKSRQEGRFERLYLAAPPSFLGTLRQNLSSPTSSLVAGEVDKDFTHFKSKEICEHLPFNI